MRTRQRTAIVILSLTLMSSFSFVNAEVLTVHGRMGAALPSDQKIRPGFSSGFGVNLALDKNFSIAVEFDHWKSDVEDSPSKLHNGKLTVSPFLIGLHYSFLPQKKLRPYVCGSLGIIFTGFAMGQIITIPEIKLSQKVENGFGFRLGAGADWKIGNNVAIFSELSYLLRKATGQTTVHDMNRGVSTQKFAQNLSSAFLQVGIKYML